MNLTQSITDAAIVGCVINGLALLAFCKRAALRKGFPAMMVYLGVRLTSDTALLSLMQAHHLFAPRVMYDIYFSLYWSSYLVSSLAVFYTVRQAFTHVMEPLPGLRRVGQLFFQWIAIISTIIVLATALHPYGLSVRAIPVAMIQLMRCMSLLELFLLAFLALTVERLGLSYRSHVFGLGLGLGTLATTDFVSSAIMRFGSGMDSTVSLFGLVGSLCAFTLWAGYFVAHEPERRGLMMPASSQLLRWNEIAMALGHTGGQVVLTPAPKPFFLDEVERTVDRVLSRNSIDAG